MTKEEIIKEAWIKYWKLLTKEDKKYILSNNGYLWRSNDYIYEHEDIDNDMDFKAGNGLRPYSLEGIEHNNGWIKIVSEEDLPNEKGDYWVIWDGNIVIQYWYSSDNSHADTQKQNSDWMKIVTHYQPIEKPKPPIY